ncbi:hypothetical protein [Pseudomonas paraeruginosa]|uniref:hypothetical protein n=1 Tax=Pseudomonas paraeruginosa TaxID=2994495 RepID=UPI0039FC3599
MHFEVTVDHRRLRRRRWSILKHDPQVTKLPFLDQYRVAGQPLADHEVFAITRIGPTGLFVGIGVGGDPGASGQNQAIDAQAPFAIEVNDGICTELAAKLVAVVTEATFQKVIALSALKKIVAKPPDQGVAFTPPYQGVVVRTSL